MSSYTTQSSSPVTAWIEEQILHDDDFGYHSFADHLQLGAVNTDFLY